MDFFFTRHARRESVALAAAAGVDSRGWPHDVDHGSELGALAGPTRSTDQHARTMGACTDSIR